MVIKCVAGTLLAKMPAEEDTWNQRYKAKKTVQIDMEIWEP